MSTKRIRTNHPEGVVYPNVFPDFAWASENRERLLDQYGECIILVYNQQVVGVGKTIQEAEAEAERRLPPDIEYITPITEFLGHRQRVFRVKQE